MLTVINRVLPISWRRSSRRHDLQFTCELDPGNLRLLPTPSSWDVGSVHSSHSGSHFQGGSLEGARCGWNHLSQMCDCTQVRPLQKLKIPAGRYRDLLVFWPLKTSLLSKSSRYLPVWSDCLSLYSLLALQVPGVSFFESARSLNNAILN